jgi:hypothetical protein
MTDPVLGDTIAAVIQRAECGSSALALDDGNAADALGGSARRGVSDALS